MYKVFILFFFFEAVLAGRIAIKKLTILLY